MNFKTVFDKGQKSKHINTRKLKLFRLKKLYNEKQTEAIYEYNSSEDTFKLQNIPRGLFKRTNERYKMRRLYDLCSQILKHKKKHKQAMLLKMCTCTIETKPQQQQKMSKPTSNRPRTRQKNKRIA